jgi:hypothetical protein
VRLLRGLLAGALALPAMGIASGTAPVVGCAAAAATPNHVAVVVEHGNQAVVRVCVGFSGPTINAEAALRASGLELGINGSGGLGDEVCQIDGEPAAYDPTECLKSGQPFWSLWVAQAGGAWGMSHLGVSSVTLAGGDAEGWRFETGGGAAPPSPQGTCPATASAPAATPTPTRSPPATAAPTAAVAAASAAGRTPVAAALPVAASSSVSAPAATGAPHLPAAAPPAPALTAGPLLRSGPAAVQPTGGGRSLAGWGLLGILLAAGAAVLALQLRRRSRSS